MVNSIFPMVMAIILFSVDPYFIVENIENRVQKKVENNNKESFVLETEYLIKEKAKLKTSLSAIFRLESLFNSITYIY